MFKNVFKKGNLEEVKTCVKNKRFYVEDTDNYGNTYIEIACLNNNLNVVEYLFQNKNTLYNTSAVWNGVILFKLCKIGNIDAIKLLFKYSDKIKNYERCINHAYKINNMHMLELLLENGKNQDYYIFDKYHNPKGTIYHCITNNNINIINLLLKYYKNINNCSGNRNTQLHIAYKEKCNDDIINFLLLNDRININKLGSSSVNMLSILCNDLKLEYIKILLKRNDVELSDVNLNDINMLFAKIDMSKKIELTRLIVNNKHIRDFILDKVRNNGLFVTVCKNNHVYTMIIIFNICKIPISDIKTCVNICILKDYWKSLKMILERYHEDVIKILNHDLFIDKYKLMFSKYDTISTLAFYNIINVSDEYCDRSNDIIVKTKESEKYKEYWNMIKEKKASDIFVLILKHGDCY